MAKVLEDVVPAAETADIASFSESVLAHLKLIYESSCRHDSASDFNAVQNDPDFQIGGPNTGNDRLASLASFLSYMASPAGRAHQTAESPDLSAQISHYYISSSHNTYLTGNQLYSEASTAAYTNVLLRGCRCLEIDVWDGLSRSTSISSRSGSGEPAEMQLSQKEHILNGHSRMKSLSNGVRQMIKRAASTRRNKSPKTSDVQILSKSISKTTDNGGSVALREPRVLHGHTLTKEVSFRDVCYAIRDSAFVQSDLPIIVSLEVHAGHDQQQMMVDIMREAWKGYLVEIEAGEIANLPRLQDLRRKILIKVKWSPPDSKASKDLAQTEEKIEELEDGLKKLDTAAGEDPTPQRKEKGSKILHALGELAVYTRAFHFSNFTQKEATMPTHVFSLSEAAVKDAHENHRQALLDHNREFLMRVYPSGIRVDSSNPDPIFYWKQGAQMVALNWQNCDKGMMINDAMFPDGAGWVMKPSPYRSTKGNDNDCTDTTSDSTGQTVDLSIEVYAGQQIYHAGADSQPGSNFHPYLICQLHLCKAEEALSMAAELPHSPEKSSTEEKAAKKYKLRSKTSTGTNPDFKGERLEFPTAKGILQDLSFIRFKIKDDEFGRDSCAAWACIRLDRLKQGYRFVHLKDPLGQPSAGVLLVKINKRVSIP